MEPNPGRLRHYDKQGNPITFWEWMHLFESEGYQVVKQEDVARGRYMVSTVWLGIDHRFIGSGPPLIFETMVFPRATDDGTVLAADLEMLRYSTEEEALQGHQRIIEQIGVLEAARPSRALVEDWEQEWES